MHTIKSYTFRVFFSWQSDRIDVKKAIQRELDTIAKKLEKEDINLIIDHDTRDRVGTQNIDIEVLQKISSCDIFIADVTPVCKILSNNNTSIPVKLISNPNVMYESGYALARKGLGKMIFLALLEPGETIAQLPFDINHNTITPIHDLEQIPALYSMIKKIIDIVRHERMSMKTAYDCNVRFRQDDQMTEQLTLAPRYKKIFYVSSHSKHKERSSIEAIPAFDVMMKYVDSISKTGSLIPPAGLTSMRTYSEKINHSMCPIKLAVSNIGERALENLYLFLKLDDSGATFAKSNRESMALLISPPKTNYYIEDENNILSDIGMLNPNMLQNISTIYLNIPSGVEQITLYWSIQTTTHSQSGQLLINVKPDYIHDTQVDDSKNGIVEIFPFIEKI